MFKKFLGIIMVMVATSAVALDSNSVNSAGFSKLSDTEKAEIIKMVADKAEKNNASENVPKKETVDAVERWVSIGSNIGKGLAGAAKEVGVAVNEFAMTPVGILTTVLIVWNFMGATLMHVIGAFIVWGLGFWFTNFLVKKNYPDTIIYSATEKNWFGNRVVDKVVKGSMDSGDTVAWYCAYFVVFFAGIIVFFSG